MRKYLATVIQVMALPRYQHQWVAQHLGHTEAVHEKFYRQSLDSVEVAKISKLMFLVDHCKMNQVQGMDLDNIDTFLEKEDVFKSVDKTDYAVSMFPIRFHEQHCEVVGSIVVNRIATH